MKKTLAIITSILLAGTLVYGQVPSTSKLDSTKIRSASNPNALMSIAQQRRQLDSINRAHAPQLLAPMTPVAQVSGSQATSMQVEAGEPGKVNPYPIELIPGSDSVKIPTFATFCAPSACNTMSTFSWNPTSPGRCRSILRKFR